MIEIEKKFLLTDSQQKQLLDGAKGLGNKRVEDSYLDTDDYQLTTKDYWFRLRDGVYELKAPLKSGSGSYAATNRYHEITDQQEIAKELSLPAATDFSLALSKAGIKSFITCFTDRTSYEKGGFHIDVDAVSYLDSDFEYAIAEIELIIENEDEADEAEQKIIDFAKGFGLTVDQVILGKVGAYLKTEKPDHYQALVDADVLK